MDSILQLWDLVTPYWKAFVFALGVVYVGVGLIRVTNFLSEVIYEPQESRLGQMGNWLKGMSHAIRLLYYAPGLIISLRGRRFLGARYYAELQILLPKSP